ATAETLSNRQSDYYVIADESELPNVRQSLPELTEILRSENYADLGRERMVLLHHAATESTLGDTLEQ
ncbi:MAG: hypothetical protein KDN04_23135, partial [Verrucomicrobiae bacterium]|nr:hypothetical protein [Verrucomicrobiae bacterium]